MIFKALKMMVFILGMFVSGFPVYAQTDESAKILAQTGPGVIQLVVYGKDKQEIAKGSAFAIADKIAVTSYHLISPAASCVGFNIKQKEIDINGVVAVNKALDLALIQISGKVTPLAFGGGDDLAVGKKISVVGVNEAGEFKVYEGKIQSLFDFGEGMKVVEPAISVSETCSGGVALGESGKVIGVFQILERRLRFIAPAAAVAAMPKTAKPTAFKNWQAEDYLGTQEAAWLTGRIYAWTGEAYSAQKGLEKVTKAQPNNLEAWTLLAKVYDGQRDYQNAVAAFKKITELDPNREEAFFGMGQIYVRMQKSTEAVAALEKALSLDPNHKEAIFALGTAYEDAREFQKAGDAYEKYLTFKPENAWQAFQRLGMARLNDNQFEAAAAALAEAFKVQTQDQNIGYNLAQAYQKAGKLAEAEDIFKKLAEISPKDAVNYFSYILKMYGDAQKPDKAVDAAKKIVELKPNDELAWINLGNMQLQMQKYPEAIEAFKKAIAIRPTYDLGHIQLGACLYNLKKYPEAIESFKKVVEIDPNSGTGWLYIGISNMQMKKFEAALEPLKRTVELQPENANAWYNLGICYLNLKDKFSAQAVVKKLQAIDPAKAKQLQGYIK